MDSRSAGSHGSLYPDLKGDTKSLDAPEAEEVFSKGKVTVGRMRKARSRSPGPIGLQIDPTHMETFDRDDYCVGVYLDDLDGEQSMLPSRAGARTSSGSTHSDDLLNGFDDSFVHNNGGGSVYGEVDLNDNDEELSDTKPAASSRKNSRSRQTQNESDNRSVGSRSVKSSKSVHTNPGVLRNDKAQRTRKSAPKQTTAAERLAQFGSTITKVRSAGSMHGLAKLHARPTQTVDPVPSSANAPAESSTYPSQMDKCGLDAYTSPKNADWGQPANFGTINMPTQSTSLVQGQIETTRMHNEPPTFLVKPYKSVISPQPPVHHRGGATLDSHNAALLGGNDFLSHKPLATKSNTPYDAQQFFTGHDKNPVHVAPSASTRAGLETLPSGPLVMGVPSYAQKPRADMHVNDSHQRPYLKPTPTPLETPWTTPYVPSAGNNPTPLLVPQAPTRRHESHLGIYSAHVSDGNHYNPSFAHVQPPSKPVATQSSYTMTPPSPYVEMIGRTESLSMQPPQTHISTYNNLTPYGRPVSTDNSARMPPAPVVAPHLGQSEHDKFQDALKHLKTTAAASRTHRQPPEPQTAALKTPPGVAGAPFYRPSPMEQPLGGPAHLPQVDHTITPPVNERYDTMHENSTSLPTKKKSAPASTWGRSHLEQPLGGPAHLPHVDHTITPPVNERYDTMYQNPMSLPTKKKSAPASTWGRSPFAASPNISKKGHSIMDDGTNRLPRSQGPLDSFSPPPPASATKITNSKNTPTVELEGTKPKKASSFGSLGAMVGSIRRGKHK